jgi:uncharacterized protein YcbK (DUF882 family)
MNRRRFLLTTAALLSVPRAVFAAPMPSLGARLRLVDAHSNTVFDGAYRDATGPIKNAIVELDLFLRDRHTGAATNIDVGVLDFLVAVMAAIGQTSAVVLSAYRSYETNKKLALTNFGVADNSEHLYGKAIDVSFPVGRLLDAVAAARAMKRGGVGWYPHSEFIHIDTGPVRNWDLGGEGLKEQLLRWPQPTPISPKPTGVMLVEGPGHLTVGGGKPVVALPGRTLPGSKRVVGLLRPLVQSQ